MALHLITVLSATVWVNMTVYDVLPEDCRHTISEKNVGDPAGDAFFNVKDKYLPVACAKCKADPALCRHDAAAFDCTNPESNGNLVVRKIEVEVSGLDDKGYTLCNDQRGKCGYYCAGPYFPDPHHVPTGIGLCAPPGSNAGQVGLMRRPQLLCCGIDVTQGGRLRRLQHGATALVCTWPEL